MQVSIWRNLSCSVSGSHQLQQELWCTGNSPPEGSPWGVSHVVTHQPTPLFTLLPQELLLICSVYLLRTWALSLDFGKPSLSWDWCLQVIVLTMITKTAPPTTQATLCHFHIESPPPWSSLRLHSPAHLHSWVCEGSNCIVFIAQWEEIGSPIHVKNYWDGPTEHCVLGLKVL